MENLASSRTESKTIGGGKAFALAAVTVDKKSEDVPVSKEEIAEAFAFYDKKRAGTLSLQKLRPLMMSLGIALTEEEFAQVHKNVRSKHGNKINLGQPVVILHSTFLQ